MSLRAAKFNLSFVYFLFTHTTSPKRAAYSAQSTYILRRTTISNECEVYLNNIVRESVIINECY